ncbi:uncharacterized protein LOC121373552 [Gigantopelta aegis]|uniref:uncharacterized protein LOC121373552 n=1 Tax=Gigantopelta aegis TaxID=1735272 RepID=UPI001B88C12E|nr:uncharacterized protein LOC121373552 [Gigantopelta aegis]XP_041356164.1 uncharacterized protein LOC121373552 [Gigantopelta aegis]
MTTESPSYSNKVGAKSPDQVMENGGDNYAVGKPPTISRQSSPLKTVLQLAVCVVSGFVFGLCLEKARVFEPKAIRYQMVFEKWIMLKMFLAAAAAGQLFLALMSVIPYTKEKFNNVVDNFMVTFDDKGILTSILGPFILGVGMTISGSCPGMVLAQVGAWAPNAIFTFLGTLCGAFLYGLVAPFLVRITRPKTTYSWQQ